MIALAIATLVCGCSEAHMADLDACSASGCSAMDADSARPFVDSNQADAPPPPDTTAAPGVDGGWVPPSGCAPLIDTRPIGPPGPGLCTAWGRVGSRCLANACFSGETCLDLPLSSVQAAFGLQQGNADDPARPGYAQIQVPQAMCDWAPLNAFAGTLCAVECDTSAIGDTCGACQACSDLVTQMPLIAMYGGVAAFFGARARFPGHEGLCRLECTWSPTERGAACDDVSTCDAFASVCLEECRSDNECNTTVGTTYEGERVTLLSADHPAHCNGATGRCEWTGTPGAVVGATCTSNDQCAPGTGVCLPGGRCAELLCPDPGTATSTCGVGGRGVCLPVNGTVHASTLCLLGCNTSADCGPRNACQLFGGGIVIGTHGGYCIGVCDSDDQCIAAETCTDVVTTDATGVTISSPGRCVPRCAHAGAVGTGAAGDCATAEWCAPDHAGAGYGWCQTLGGFCGASNTPSLTPPMATACAPSEICDETLATPHAPPSLASPAAALVRELAGDGHCVRPCVSAADCAGYPAGAVCVSSGALTGLCRVPCSTPTSSCPPDQVCDAALAYCVELPPPT